MAIVCEAARGVGNPREHWGFTAILVGGIMNESISFFKKLFARTRGFIELRAFPSCERIFTRDYHKLSRFVEAHLDENVFFGVATRSRKSGSKADCAEIPALWVDIDWKDFSGGQKEAARRLIRFAVTPSIEVESGHGRHVYWLLQKPIAAGLHIEAYLKGLASTLNGDHASAEVARILRVPGTFNFKQPTRRAVECVSFTGQRYRLEDFEPWKMAESRVRKPTVIFSNVNHFINVDGLRLSSALRTLIKHGWTGAPYKSRSEADMAAISGLLRIGIDSDQIRAIFREYPIGEKYREKGTRGDGYLSRSIGSAKAFLAEMSPRGRNEEETR
jgi:putative DNA primase/helicase